MTRIKIEEAAALLQIPAQAIRVQMRKKKLPIGFTYENKGRFTYVIYKERVEEFINGGQK